MTKKKKQAQDEGSLFLPQIVKIGGHHIQIICPYTFTEAAGCHGMIDHAAGEIRIATVDSGGQERDTTRIIHTYWHEVLHAIDRVYAMGRLNDMKDGEAIVEALAEGLTQHCMDNDLPRIGGES
jgi:hypothetical protein